MAFLHSVHSIWLISSIPGPTAIISMDGSQRHVTNSDFSAPEQCVLLPWHIHLDVCRHLKHDWFQTKISRYLLLVSVPESPCVALSVSKLDPLRVTWHWLLPLLINHRVLPVLHSMNLWLCLLPALPSISCACSIATPFSLTFLLLLPTALTHSPNPGQSYLTYTNMICPFSSLG